MAWMILIVAALLEIGWAIGLKYSDGFSNIAVTVPTVGAMVGSMLLLSQAAKTLPIGTAYGVWVGIGAAGAAVLGMILFDEAANIARILCLVLLLGSIVGLKLTSGH